MRQPPLLSSNTRPGGWQRQPCSQVRHPWFDSRRYLKDQQIDRGSCSVLAWEPMCKPDALQLRMPTEHSLFSSELPGMAN